MYKEFYYVLYSIYKNDTFDAADPSSIESLLVSGSVGVLIWRFEVGFHMKTQNLFLCPILMTWAGQKWIGNHFWTSQSEPAEELFTCVVYTLIFLVLTYEHLIVCKKGLF